MTRRYTKHTKAERLEALRKSLATKEAYHKKHLDRITLQRGLMALPENPPATPEPTTNG